MAVLGMKVVRIGGNCSAFIQEFRNWDSAWALEALYVIAYEIRVLAERVICCSIFSVSCFRYRAFVVLLQ